MRASNFDKFTLKTIFVIVTGICVLLASVHWESKLLTGLFGWLQTVLLVLVPLILVQYPLFVLLRKHLPSNPDDTTEL